MADAQEPRVSRRPYLYSFRYHNTRNSRCNSSGASEVHASIRRARAARLVHGPELGDPVNAKALEEFLVHGKNGGMTRGIPTASAAEPLNRKNDSGRTGSSLALPGRRPTRLRVSAPLQASATSCLQDRELYQLLALVDALRDGSARERELANRELSARLKN